MTETHDKQQYAFQTEIKQLLHLLSHSLYQNKEITIRELVSNASDALDKMRYLQLTEEQYRDEIPLEITLEPDKDNRVLAIRDTGIGLTQEELVENLGTIAHSGSLDFLSKLSGDEKTDLSLIGQFGVGFYSSFMLADRVEVVTRSYKESDGWRWESEGTGEFTIEPAEGLERGTTIKLHLKEGLEEFTDAYRLKHIIGKYSTFIPHPIKLEDEQLNDQRPIWVEPKSQLDEEQYTRFYQHLSHHTEEKPLWHLHLSADSPIQFHTILYCPQTSFENMGFGRSEHGIHLCAKRILVQDNNRDLLPEYLRFLYGLVDSADLPLNVSRESLQDNTIFRKIQKVLVKRVLDHLAKLSDNEPETYETFYTQFGKTLREGVATDFEHREGIAKLLRFSSSVDDKLTSLDAYLERAGEKQKQIYYLGGPDLGSIKKSPNLELFRKRNIEVLFLTDPLDEIVLSNLGQYKEHALVSIDAADVELPDAEDSEKKEDESSEEKAEDKDTDEVPTGFEKVLTLFRDALGDEVEEVKRSKRLIDSPCCLVNPSGAVSTQMQKMMHMANKEFSLSKRIFEINPSASLIRRLSELTANPDHDNFIRDCGRQLYSNALLMEGLAPDPEGTVNRMQQFMTELAGKRSPIVT